MMSSLVTGPLCAVECRARRIANIRTGAARSRPRPSTILQPAARLALIAVVILAPSAALAAGAPQPLSGDYRLLLGFIEDGAIVTRALFEAGAAGGRGDTGTDLGASFLAAFRLGRDVETGVMGGVLRRDRDAGAELYGSTVPGSFSSTGPSDLRIYGKYRFRRSPVDLSAGASFDLPLAASDSGLTSGALRARGFVAVRGRLAGGTAIIGHAGVASAGDAEYGDGAAGRLSAVAGVGVLGPLSRLWTLVGELDYQGAPFEGDHASTRLLAGLDWRPTGNIAARGGLIAGWSQGDPDYSGILSLMFHF
jgi:hypothetical protein